MKKLVFFLFCLWLGMQAAGGLNAQPLAGTDDLGRTLPQNDAVGDPKSGRQVGMFYFLWLGHGTAETYWDLHEIVSNHPEVLEDFDHPMWGTPVHRPGGPCPYYFWGQPVYGYYRSTDYWVALRNIQLLTDAGIDFVIMDATNHNVYPVESDILMKAMDAVRKQGKNPPKIVFYTNTNSGSTMQKAYDNFYKKGAPYYHPDCWYYLDGKPLIIGVSKEAAGTDYEKFFTYRESQWPNVPDLPANGWPWISFVRPQKVYSNDRGEPEIINVSVAQHPNPSAGMGGSAFYGNMDNWGRSYRNGSHGNPETDIFYGYNFQEQWDNALQADPPFVFVTGWNEWIAGRWGDRYKNKEHSWFCDQASPEYSRDLEPTFTAGLKDNYYMQLVDNVRRYKGVERNPDAGPAKTIRKMGDWKKVLPKYVDYTGEASPRDHRGAQSKPEVVYTDNSCRNDFHILKVARDAKNLYFYAETVNKITATDGDKWMALYLDTDRNSKTGWNGYDYRVVYGDTLQKYAGGSWKEAGKAFSTVDGNKMMVTIPRGEIGLPGALDFEFKWSDNLQKEDPLYWYVSGDAAPGGRFNYIYTAK